jgi:hypothetical protein
MSSLSSKLPSHSQILQSVFGGDLDDHDVRGHRRGHDSPSWDSTVAGGTYSPEPTQESQQQAERTESSDPVFRCTLESADTLCSLLNAILMDRKENMAAHWTVTPQGIKIAVDRHRVLQAKVYLKADSFQTFELRSDDLIEDGGSLNFVVSLAVLVDCLSVFGDADAARSVHLDIVMESPDEPLCLMYACLVLMLEF